MLGKAIKTLNNNYLLGFDLGYGSYAFWWAGPDKKLQSVAKATDWLWATTVWEQAPEDYELDDDEYEAQASKILRNYFGGMRHNGATVYFCPKNGVDDIADNINAAEKGAVRYRAGKDIFLSEEEKDFLLERGWELKEYSKSDWLEKE